jgi:hypothetical protein
MLRLETQTRTSAESRHDDRGVPAKLGSRSWRRKKLFASTSRQEVWRNKVKPDELSRNRYVYKQLHHVDEFDESSRQHVRAEPAV